MLTGSDGQKVEVVDRKSCVFRLDARTYYANKIIAHRITVQKWTRQRGYYIRVGLHGKAKVMEETYAGIVSLVMDHEPFVDPPDYDRVVRAWKYIYANGCKPAVNPSDCSQRDKFFEGPALATPMNHRVAVRADNGEVLQ